jgi:hypothetical protein
MFTVQLPADELELKIATSPVLGTDAPPGVAVALVDQFAVLFQLPTAFLTQYLFAIY